MPQDARLCLHIKHLPTQWPSRLSVTPTPTSQVIRHSDPHLTGYPSLLAAKTVTCDVYILVRLSSNSSTIHQWVLMTRLAITLFFSMLLAALAACDKQCENDVISSTMAPSGHVKAVVFQRGCGATVGANIQVSILEASQTLPNESGNVLIVGGQQAPILLWHSDSQLEIRTIDSPQKFKRETHFSDIVITYKSGT